MFAFRQFMIQSINSVAVSAKRQTSGSLTAFRFHHIGVACRDMEKEAEALRLVGYELEGEYFTDPLQKIHGCFLVGPGPRVELLAPLDESSPIVSWLKKDIKMYHQAYEVDAIDSSLAALATHQAVVLSRPKPAIAFGGRKVAFLMLPNRLLVELIENPELQGAVE